jgi:hypothetical protein
MGKRKAQRGRVNPAQRTAADSAAWPLRGGILFIQGSWLAPLVASVSLLAVYVATLAPSVVGGDSGELTAAALTGGVPHPPGYPLFAMLARLFAALPLGHSLAWRVNLLSATSTALAAGLVCAVVQLWTDEAAPGLAAAALFGTNSVVWLHATSAEVFGLNALFVASTVLLWLCAERSAARRFVFGLCFVSGLAMCNHHTFVFVGAPLVLRSLWVARRRLYVSGIAASIALGLCGLLPYVYLSLASRASAGVSWGDQTSLGGLVAHVLRLNYGTFSMGQASRGGAFIDQGTFLPTLWRMWGHAFPRFLWIGPPFALLGIYLGGKDRQMRTATYVLAGVLCGYVVAFCLLSNLSTSRALYLTVLDRFSIQADLMLAIAMGLGFAKTLSWARGHWSFMAKRPHLVHTLVLILFALGVSAHASDASERNNRVFSDFVRTAFASLPSNAIVITMGDHLTGSVFYFHEVERLRPDVVHLDRELLGFTWYEERKRRLYPDLFLPEGGYGRSGWNIKQLLDGNPRRPLVVIDRLEAWDQSWKDGYKLATSGLVHPLVPAGQFPSFEEWLARDRRAMGSYDVMPALRAREGSWESALGDLVMSTQGGRAHLALVYSNENGNVPTPARLAVSLLEDIVAKAGGDERLGIAALKGLRKLALGAAIWKDLGIGYEILSRVDRAYYPRVALAYERYVETAAADDPDLPAARTYLTQHQPPRSLSR